MKQRQARLILIVLTAALLFGTLMPGSWKDSATSRFRYGDYLPMLAHIALFAAMSFVTPMTRLWAIRRWQVLGLALGFALLTEGLQFFAIDRHPNLSGVAQDMTGALIGLWLFAAMARRMNAGRALTPPEGQR